MSDGPLICQQDRALLSVVAQAFHGARSEGAAPLPVGVAVSGGGDSMALLHAMQRVAPDAGLAVHAVTVDHGLRAEAAAEAAGVAAFCAGLGVPHYTLRWEGPTPAGNLMDQARRARLSLIGDWARTRGIGHVVLGHTADDQAETFLMNLSRAAGLDGLSGMRSGWTQDGIAWSRPFLAQTRTDLRDYLLRNGVAWVDDPSNDNDRFNRVKARRALRALKPLGISTQRLCTTIINLSMAHEVVARATAKAAEAIAEQAGALRFGRQELVSHPSEVQRRLLIGMIRWMNGADYPPRETQVSHLQSALHDGRDATLGGVRFRARGDAITVTREPRAAMGPVALGQVWDHRWHVTGPGKAEVRALGIKGLAQVPDWRASGVPRDAAVVSPAVWKGDRLIAAPLLMPDEDFTATLTASFSLFMLSH